MMENFCMDCMLRIILIVIWLLILIILNIKHSDNLNLSSNQSIFELIKQTV